MNRLFFACSLLLAACGVSEDNGSDPVTGVDAGGGGGGGGGGDPQVCSKMDILFVIDDSGSMGEEQSNLAQNFPQFINVLNDYRVEGTGILDYRVAVTTTGKSVDYTIDPPPVEPPIPLPIPPVDPPAVSFSDTGDNGALRQECGMTRRWLERDDANLASTFSCVADVGTSGPALEMPLLATQMALNERISDGTNAGFIREDSLLGIVYLTDEDDCSRRDNGFTIESEACTPQNTDMMLPQETINFLDSFTGARGRWATAVIAGASACESSFGEAREATNMKEFVNLTGQNAVFSSICDGDLTTALQQALDTFEAACEGFPPID